MRKRTCYAAAMVIGVLATAGCAHAAATSPAAGAASSVTAQAPTPSAATSPSGTAPACPAPLPPAGALNLSAQDSGKTFCVTRGTVVVVMLRGTLDAKWQPPRISSGSLKPTVDPRMLLQVGVTGAAYLAIRPGVAAVTSARYPCRLPEPAGSAAAVSSATPAVHCASSRMVFQVTLVVTAR